MTESARQDVTAHAAAATDGTASDQPPFRYDARLANEIEEHWQEYWQAEGTFSTPNPSGPLDAGFDRVAGLPKLYIMDMFPYPSGAGLHVGHPLGYIGTDVYARYLRMTGHNVLHPFGYDAFGLPAEQYALDTGQHPAITTRHNIANMRRQLRRLGLGHDTRRELATTDVGYYRWTQWIFLKIFNSWFDPEALRARPIEELITEFDSGARAADGPANPGGLPWAELTSQQRRQVVDGYRLAYISEELVNWCPGLGTVLANEEITADGRSDIGNYPVYRRPLRQWMLRITAYAERLLGDLDLLDWPDSIKVMQRNWIGPSDGASIDFSVAGSDATIRVFTTRPDTLAGATYMVLAPEHPLVDEITPADWPDGTPEDWRHPEGGQGLTPAAAVAAYREAAARLSDRQRADEGYDKTGVFTGGYAVNPMTGRPIPVFIADYVLMGYGTGAIMAVPAHDERDFEFARRFALPIRAVLQPSEAWCTGHGLSAGAATDEWPEAYVGDHGYLDLEVPGLVLTGLDKTAAIAAAIAWLEQHQAGEYERSYRLRDWLFSRQRYWGEPFPIVYDDDGLPIALPEGMLPVELPEITDFRPEPQQDESSDPVPPLARATDWTTVELDLGDGPRRYRRELNTMPQWAGSCWYYLRYLDPVNERHLVDPGVERYWMVPEGAAPSDGGVDLYVGGVEHAVLHLLYARFWHKVLYDLGYVSTKEPFKRLFNQGYIQADAYLDERGMYVPATEVIKTDDGRYSYQGEPVTARAGKMGKSLKNAVAPDDIYAAYGADTLRLYEMAMGPLDTDRPWQTDDMVGVYRFLQRLWRNVVDEHTGEVLVADKPLDDEAERRLHHTIKVVRHDFGELRFNTAIARLIELNNHASRLVARDGMLPRAMAEPLVLMVAPLAPHIAETLWSRLGHSQSLTYEPFPEFDESLAAHKSVVMPVQVNGKRRFQIEVTAGADEEEIRAHLLAQPDFTKHTDGLAVQRVVIVPGRIVNIVAR
ncbi:MAG TPA: leucine--tRNA ligase [Streptosporangiaceae bacterium]|jgi:leucyl-tRNA synthetase|nr:leucine--tRNA ligase [Streptosporangiaceae bacterium]